MVSKEPVTIIDPKTCFSFLDFKELWEYRELFLAFVQRDIKVRYKQTVIGVLWALFQPLITMVVFTIFFGTVAQIGSDGMPYTIFSYSGLILWTYFAGALANASNSMLDSSSLITKVYFPRIIIPISSTLTGLIDYLIASIVLIMLLFYYRVSPPNTIILLPVILFLTWMFVSGLGLFLSALNVKYHDVKHLVPFFISLMLFFTPVIYPLSIAPNYRFLLMLNPMTGLIEAHRAIILGSQSIDFLSLGVSAVITLIIFIGGTLYFRKVERYFADII